MADDRNSPEKQLLRLIEESKGKETRKTGAGLAPKISFRNMFGQLAGRLSFLSRLTRKRTPGSGRRGLSLNLGALNHVLMGVAVALLVYLVSDAAASVIQMGRPINLTAKMEPAAASAPEAVSPLNDSAYYLQKVASRDIFKEGGEPAASTNQAPAPAQESAAVSSLSLVGISWSSNPDCIIEDKESKRTFFVKRGQVIGDGVKVEAIFKDHVVLTHDGQEFELR